MSLSEVNQAGGGVYEAPEWAQPSSLSSNTYNFPRATGSERGRPWADRHSQYASGRIDMLNIRVARMLLMRATWWFTVALGLSPDYPSGYSRFSSRSEDNTDYEDQPMDEDISTTNEEVDVYEEVGACRDEVGINNSQPPPAQNIPPFLRIEKKQHRHPHPIMLLLRCHICYGRPVEVTMIACASVQNALSG